MKTRSRTLCLSLLVMTPLAASTAWASVSPSLPAAHTVGPITYVSVSADAAQTKAVRAEESRYPLELLFLWGRGAKETPVDVQWSIKNAAGKELIDAQSKGPEVLASLPNGRYTVTASYQGTTLSRVVDVHKGTHEVVVDEWPS
jgi:hypothetical protein